MTDARQTLTPRNIAEEISGSLILSSSKVAELLNERGVQIEAHVGDSRWLPFDGFSNDAEFAAVHVISGTISLLFHESSDTASDIAESIRSLLSDED